jgi:hypothetical protein
MTFLPLALFRLSTPCPDLSPGQTDIPRIPGPLGAIFRFIRAARNEIQSQSSLFSAKSSHPHRHYRVSGTSARRWLRKPDHGLRDSLHDRPLDAVLRIRGRAIAQLGTAGQTVLLSPALFQPIASDDVADVMADVTLGAPVNGTIEIAGPERAPLSEFVGRFLKAANDPREVVADAHAPYFGLELDDRSLLPGDNPRVGATRFDDWLGQSTRQK